MPPEGGGGSGTPVRARTTSPVARAAAIAALAIVVLVIAFMLLSGGNSNQYRLRFETAGQLVPGNQVLVGGAPVGSVDKVELTDNGEAEVTITMNQTLHEGTTAAIRQTSLSGIANRYISISPGPDYAPALDSDQVITQANTVTAVDLDQLFDTLDRPTRKGLRDVIQGYGTIYASRQQQANATYKYFNPALVASRNLFAELTRDQQSLTDFLVDGSRVVTGLAQRSDDLTGLVSNGNTALGAIARENNSLDRSLVALPPALRQANTTFVNLRATLDDLDPLVETSKKATVNLAPFLHQTARTAKRSVPVFKNLRLAVNRPGPDNDLASFTGDLVGLRNSAQTALPNAIKAMVCASSDTSGCGGGPGDDPFLRFARPYMPDLLGLVTKLGQSAGVYDANGHFFRTQQISEAFDYGAGTLTPNTPATRYNNLFFPILPELQFRRCPGGATQVAGDASNPFLDDGPPNQLTSGPPPADCNATQVPPGP